MNLKYLTFLTIFLLIACMPVVQNSSAQETTPATSVETPVMEKAPVSTAIESAPTGVAWNTYNNDQLGITFEYPAIYDTPLYQECGVKISALPDSDGTEISIGFRSFLLVQPSNGVGLQEYVDNLIAQKQWMLETQENVLLAGEDAVHIDYRFGGSRFGTATVALHNNLIYAFNFTAGAFCDVPEVGLVEGNAYEHWLESFAFSQ